MKNIIVFGASNSSDSINKKLAVYASTLLSNVQTTILDLRDYHLPIFSLEEEQKGFPDAVEKLHLLFNQADGFVISFAEHNGSYAAVFKNLFDWLSRKQSKVWNQKPMLLLATSTGSRGGASVLSAAVNRFPHNGGQVVASFSLPSFKEHFKDQAIVTATYNDQLQEAVQVFSNAIDHA